MSYLYILCNERGRHYIGITNLIPEKRLLKHNQGGVHSTKLGKPWKLVYTKEFNSLREARIMEKKIKSWKGGNAFKKFLFKAAGSSNSRTIAFGAVYLGASPSPAALKRKR